MVNKLTPDVNEDEDHTAAWFGHREQAQNIFHLPEGVALDGLADAEGDTVIYCTRQICPKLSKR